LYISIYNNIMKKIVSILSLFIAAFAFSVNNSFSQATAAVKSSVSWGDVKNLESARGTSSFTYSDASHCSSENVKYTATHYNKGSWTGEENKTSYFNRYQSVSNKHIAKLTGFEYKRGYWYRRRPTYNSYMMYEIHFTGLRNSTSGYEREGLIIGFPTDYNQFSGASVTNAGWDNIWQNSFELTRYSVAAHYVSGGSTTAEDLGGSSSWAYTQGAITVYAVYSSSGQGWLFIYDDYGKLIMNYYYDFAGSFSNNATVFGIGGNSMFGTYYIDKFSTWLCDVKSGWGVQDIVNSRNDEQQIFGTDTDGSRISLGTLAIPGAGTSISFETRNGMYNNNSAPSTGLLYKRSGLDTNIYSEYTANSDYKAFSTKLVGKVELNFNLDWVITPDTDCHPKVFGIVFGQKEAVINSTPNQGTSRLYLVDSETPSYNGTFLGIYNDGGSNQLKICCLSGSSWRDSTDDGTGRYNANNYLYYRQAIGGHSEGSILSYNDLADGNKDFKITVLAYKSKTNESALVDLLIFISNSYAAPSGLEMVYRIVNVSNNNLTGFAGFGSCEYSGATTSASYNNKINTKINSFNLYTSSDYIAFNGGSLYKSGENVTNAFTIACPQYHAYLGNDLSTKYYSSIGCLADPKLFMAKITTSGADLRYTITDIADHTKGLKNASGAISSTYGTLGTNDWFYINRATATSTLDDLYTIVKSSGNYKIYFNYSTKQFVLGAAGSTPDNCTPDIVLMISNASVTMFDYLANTLDTASTNTTFMRPWDTTCDWQCATGGYYKQTKEALTTWGDTAINLFRNCWYSNSVVNGYSCSPTDTKDGIAKSLVTRYETWGLKCGDTGDALYTVSNSVNDGSGLSFNTNSDAFNIVLISILGTCIGAMIVIILIKRKKEISK